MVDETIPNGSGGIRQEGPAALFIGQYRLIKGQQGDAQFILVAVFRGGMNKLHGFRPDKAHILLNESVRCLRVCLCRLYLGRNIVLCAYQCNPSIPLQQKNTNPLPDFRGSLRNFAIKYTIGQKTYNTI